MDIDQDLRDYQKEYLDFIDDEAGFEDRTPLLYKLPYFSRMTKASTMRKFAR